MKIILHTGTLNVKLNETVGPDLRSAKEVRQGDPFSTFNFNLIVDCLARMDVKDQDNVLLAFFVP